jgi:hypothetical protein
MDKKREHDYFFNVNRTGLRLRAVRQAAEAEAD